MIVKLVFVFLQLYAAGVIGIAIPGTPCKLQDKECITKLVNAVFTIINTAGSDSGFESIDPMVHDSLTASLPSLNFALKKSTVLGFKDIKIQSASVSDHDSLYINILFPHYEMSGDYEINGNFMDKPIQGNGKYSVKANDLKMNVEVEKNYYRKDGKIYLRFPSFNSTVELLGKMKVDADNLFSGNKELADSALKLLNANDKVVSSLWGPPVTKANLNTVFKNINKLLETIPLDNIVIETPKNVSENK